MPRIPLALLLVSCARAEPVDESVPEAAAFVRAPEPRATAWPHVVPSEPSRHAVETPRRVAAMEVRREATQKEEPGDSDALPRGAVHEGTDDETHGPQLAPDDRIVAGNEHFVRLVKLALREIDGDAGVVHASTAIRHRDGGFAVYLLYESMVRNGCIHANAPGVEVPCTDPRLPVPRLSGTPVVFAADQCTYAALVHAELSPWNAETHRVVSITERIPLPSLCELEAYKGGSGLSIADVDGDGRPELTATWFSEYAEEVARGEAPVYRDSWIAVLRLDLGVQWMGQVAYQEREWTRTTTMDVRFETGKRSDLVVDERCSRSEWEFSQDAPCPDPVRTRWRYSAELDRWLPSRPQRVGAQ